MTTINEHSLETAYRQLIEMTGEDLNREGLKNTPLRAAKAMAFLTSGYHAEIEKIVNGALFSSDNRSMVIVKDIDFFSLCEHHLLPFFGKVHVGYIPKGHVIGLSKIPRIVDVFSRRLQIQEELCQQIAKCIETITGASGVGVVIEAQHLCMMMRGVQKQSSFMISSSVLGHFKECMNTRNEFLNLIK
ncbi:MAG: GTP cyclohydrolase I FolE [Gammaproteobacteria bacterium RIFCSPHIGHO2_12_FULL_41_15]|nr:MAG: GTP cyclohydrolase I FolE [Gammaproteobacteria bacterium RIFCSPHIGHO2_12_FULL_41_15]